MTPAAKPLTTAQIFLIVWFDGSIFLGLWLFGSWLVFTVRLCRNRRFLGKRGRTRIYVSDAINSPCLAWFFPAVYLTQDVLQTDEAELILRHELTHLHHLDFIMILTAYDLSTSPSGEETYTLSAEDTATLEELFLIDSMFSVPSDSESECTYQFDIGNRSYLLDDFLGSVDAVVRGSEESYTYYRKRLSDIEYIGKPQPIISMCAKSAEMLQRSEAKTMTDVRLG